MRSPSVSRDPDAALRVCVVANDPLARAGLAAMLGDDAATVATAALGDDLAGTYEARNVDVLLVDLGADPLRAAAWLDDAPAVTVPAAALLPDASRVDDVFALGFLGALERGSEAPVLRAALDAVARGLVVMDPGFHRVRATVAPERMEALTPREVEVLALLATGLPNKLIAHHLGISEHTAKFHVTAVMTKLGASSRTDAVIRAARRGMVAL